VKVWVAEMRRPVPRLVRGFAARMRESDRREVAGVSGAAGAGLARHVAEAAAETLAAGGRVWTVWAGAAPAALFGVRPDSVTAATAGIWMLAAGEADRFPLAFARWSRRLLAAARAAFPQVEAFYNFVPERPGRGLEWLRWLGAWLSSGDRFRSPWTGEVYVRFVIEAGGGGNV
jgi:hypothetical protein